MSGQQIGTVVGGIVGAYFGYPQLGAAIGGYIGGVIDPTVIKGPSIGDAQQQTSQGGMPIPKCFGHCPPIAPTLIDGDKVARKVKIKSGGKGSTTVNEQEGFRATRAFLVCEGEALIARITRNGKLVYSTIAGDNIDGDSAKFASQITIYPGDETQGPDPSLEAIHGVGNTPYYRGRCYFVVRNDDETQTGGAANQYRIEVIGSGGTVTSSCNSIYGDAIAYWPLDDAAPNGTARELVGNRNGTYTNTLGVGTGPQLRTGSAASFKMTNREDGMIADFNGDFTVVGLPEWSVAAYAALSEDVAHTSGTVLKNVATYWQSAQFGYTDWGLGFSTTNHPYCNFSDAGTVGHSTASPSATQIAWLVSTFKPNAANPSNNDFTIYVNGLAVHTETIANAPGRVGALMIVGGGAYPDSYGFIGSVSDVAVWNRALGDTEIANGFLSLSNHYDLPDLVGAIISRDGLISNACNTQVAADSVQWKTIVTEIAGRASPLLPAHLDIDNMTDTVPGFVLGNATLTGTDYVRSLCTYYTVDLPEYDDKLHAIRRGGAVVATLDPDDLLTVEDGDNDVRSPALQTFQRLTVMYPDPANKYVTTPQTAPRTSPDITTSNQVTIQCPIPFDATTMAQKADILQKIAFLQVEGTFKRAFPAEYSKYVTSDAIMFNDRRHIITKASNDDCMVTFECTYDRPSAYTSTAVGSVAPPPELPSSSVKGPTIFAAMNLPSLRSADNVPGMYIAICGLVDGYAGCDLYLSIDGGETYFLAKTLLTESTMGRLEAACDSGATDLIIASVLHGHELSSVSDAQIAARANAFAILSAGVAEIVQSKTATETATAGTYDMTGDTRGLLGTTAAAHALYDQFVMLDDTVFFLKLDASLAGKTLYFQPVSRGTAQANNPIYPVVFAPLFTSVPAADFYETELGEVITTEAGDYLQVD